MKMWTKAILGIALSLMCVCTSLGYASLSKNLLIEGDVEATPPNAIFIMGISNVQTSNVTVNTSPFRVGEASTKYMTEVVFGGANAKITFDVLVMNGTPVTQYFDKLEQFASMEGFEGTFTYERVKATVSPGQGTAIGAGEKKTFTVTLTSSASTAQTRRMLYELDFVLHSDDLTEAVSKGVTNKFEDILNNNLENIIKYDLNGSTQTVYPEETYDKVIERMKENDNSASGYYIGNLVGAKTEDKALLTALFEGELTFPVGDQEVPVTVMIKQKDVYGSNGKKDGVQDMVLYITADDLSSRMSYVPIYAVVFSQNASGEWAQIGQIFAGEARVNGYDGSFFGTGSFDTESWRSTVGYYNLGTRQGIDALMNAHMKQN